MGEETKTEGLEEKPQRFGRYEVKRVLGRGGMGVVYLAEDPVIGRQVAIKVVKADPALEPEELAELQARFEREFQSAGTLSHPNIVTVYDVGKQQDYSFIAMEYVRGESLGEVLTSNRVLSFKEVADLALQICSGLDYAHENGVVHRDIKPANILITREGRPKITDFGIAKLVSTNLTRTGTVIGTPSYMSPEQVTGHPVTGASDQFSMGVILYQVLTGEKPFSGENPTTILYKIVHEDPIAPHEINRSLPSSLDQALLRAMRKNPQERYPTCGDFAEAVRDALGAAPADATVALDTTLRRSDLESGALDRPPGAGGRRWVRWLLGAAGTLAVAAVGVGWYVTLGPGAQSGWRGLLGGSIETPLVMMPSQELPSVETILSSPLQVTADQDGAEIWVNDEPTGKTVPETLLLEGQEGESFRLELRRGGIVVAETEIILSPELSPWGAVERPPTPETFTISSDPAGASVSLNGEPLESPTPVSVDLTPGNSYQVALELKGYGSTSFGFAFPGDLTEEQRSEASLFFRLKSAVPPGFVYVNADYPVEIEVGGRRHGPATTLEIPLPPGSYVVKYSAPEVFLDEQRKNVGIESGDRVPLVVPPAVEITISAVPANCEVSIDGRFVDVPPIRRRVVTAVHTFTCAWPQGPSSSRQERITANGQRVFFSQDDP